VKDKLLPDEGGTKVHKTLSFAKLSHFDLNELVCSFFILGLFLFSQPVED